MGSIIFISLFT